MSSNGPAPKPHSSPGFKVTGSAVVLSNHTENSEVTTSWQDVHFMIGPVANLLGANTHVMLIFCTIIVTVD